MSHQLSISRLRIIEIGDEEVNYVLTIKVDDYDGLNWVKVKLGILAPLANLILGSQ